MWILIINLTKTVKWPTFSLILNSFIIQLNPTYPNINSCFYKMQILILDTFQNTISRLNKFLTASNFVTQITKFNFLEFKSLDQTTPYTCFSYWVDSISSRIKAQAHTCANINSSFNKFLTHLISWFKSYNSKF